MIFLLIIGKKGGEGGGGGGGEYLSKVDFFVNLFKEHSFLHIISKIQDDLPVIKYFIKF